MHRSIGSTKDRRIGVSASDSPDKIVEAAALGVSLDGNQVLGDVVLMLPSRSLVGLIGPNGSGKTTLLRAVGGLVGYTGSLRVAGKEVNEWKRALFAQRVAFVRPATSMAFDFRVFDLVLLARSVRKRWLQPYSDEDDAVAHRALESVDLDRLKDRSIHALSSGEQQRVFLAQAMAQEPELLLLDEPTSHLDIHHQFSFMDRIRRFVDEGGSAIAAVHDLELACRYSDYLVILDKGRLVDFGRPGTILTERLIEKVFRVRAEVSTDADRVENIRYVGSA